MPSVPMKRSSSCTTWRPVSSMASLRIARGRDGGWRDRRRALAERRILLERRDVLVLDLPLLDPAPHLLGELRRQDPLVLQRPQPLQDDGCGGDGAQNDRPHHGTAGFHVFQT